jgi:hypothetical protein
MENPQPNNSEGPAPVRDPAKPAVGASAVSRRRMIQAIVAAAPVILTVTARRAQAQGSPTMSGVPSVPP